MSEKMFRFNELEKRARETEEKFRGSSAMLLSLRIELVYEWEKWVKEIPFIPFPPEWLVQPIPPFMGAVARFQVAHRERPQLAISIYLDCYDQLGFFGRPYWEIYPVEGDTNRVAMEDVSGLLEAIQRGLENPVEGK